MIFTLFGTRFLEDHAWMIMRVTITALDSKQGTTIGVSEWFQEDFFYPPPPEN